jgi:hypothetical protein
MWLPQADEPPWTSALIREILAGRADQVRWWLSYVGDAELQMPTPSTVEDPPSMPEKPAVAQQEQEQSPCIKGDCTERLSSSLSSSSSSSS